MKRITYIIIAGLFLCQLAIAGENSKITLNDGTIIYGKVVGMAEGVYKIDTESMGEISVNSDKVLEISSKPLNQKQNSNKNIAILDGNNNQRNNSSSSTRSSNNYQSQQETANAKVQSMAANPDFANSLLDLAESSEMMNILNDPQIMEAIQSGDYDFLLNNDKMNSLMNSQEIQDILGSM